MAKVVTTLDICENAKLARDLALAGELFVATVARSVLNGSYCDKYLLT